MQRFLSKAEHKPRTNKFNKLMKAKQKTEIAKSSRFVTVAGYKIDKEYPTHHSTKVKVDGQTLEICIFNLLEKYRAQKFNNYIGFEHAPIYAESPKARKRAEAYRKWGMDGQPSGIKNDEEYIDIQVQLFGEVVRPFTPL